MSRAALSALSRSFRGLIAAAAEQSGRPCEALQFVTWWAAQRILRTSSAAVRQRDVLELKLIETADALAAARGALAKLDEERRAAEAQLARISLAEVKVPAGSLIWSVTVAPGATVGRGAPLLEWIDCSQPLVDVPVSEVGLALISDGMTAEVWIDELARPVAGTVIYTRGAAARLDERELAATADGSDSTRAQVVLALEASQFGPENCPVGRAAFVDFPAIGPLDRFRAFLRF